MIRRRTLAAVALFALALSLPLVACKGTAKDEAPAIREAVTSYVRDVKHLSVDQMNIEVAELKVEGETATCKATFNLKAGGMPPLVYDYKLTKKDGKWSVATSSAAAGMAGHGGGSGMPGGMPPAGMPGAAGSGAAPMPAGHPPVGGSAAPAPAGSAAAH